VKAKHVLAVASALLILLGGRTFGQSKQSLKLSGDLRLRYEKDYDVTGKDNRDRARYRFRLNVVHRRGDHIQLGARFVSGDPNDQQSPHQTFGGDFSAKTINIDKVYLRYNFDRGWVWAGKNSFPFWKQNELFWDDDVSPEGIAAAYSAKDFAGSGSNLTLTGGQFIVQNRGKDFFQSSMSAGQATFSKKTGGATLTAAAGYYYFNNDFSDTTSYNPLADMNHKLIVLSGQAKFNLSANVPVKFGVDFMKNTEDPLIAAFANETTGFVLQASVGKLKKQGDWLLGAYYVRIEKFAVIPNFAQDDWWRFGNGHTDSSDMKGFELRAAYQLGPKMNLVARHYVTEMIVGTKDANRFRLDLNVKY